MPVRSVLFLLTFFGASLATFRAPLIGVINYMALYLFAPNHNWWAHAILHLGIRFFFLATVCLIIGMILNWGELRQRVEGLMPIEWAFIAFLAVIWLSTIIGVPITDVGRGLVEKMTKLVIFLFLMTHCVTRVKDFRAIRWLWVAGGLYLGYRCFEASSAGRLTGIGGPDFAGSSGMSAHLAFTLVFVGVSFLLDKRWWARAITVMSGGLVMNALVMMRTRGSFLALGIGAIVSIFVLPRAYRGMLIVALLVGGLGAYSLTDALYWERMGTITTEEGEEIDRSASVRKQLWSHSLDILADHPLGVGVGNFPKVIGDYASGLTGRASHNTFVRIYVDLGLQGIAVYLLVIVLAFRSLKRVKRLAEEHERLHELGIEATGMGLAILIALIAGFFTERSYVEGYWWLFAMTVCLERAANHALLEPAQEKTRLPADVPASSFLPPHPG